MFAAEFESPCVVNAPEDDPDAFVVMVKYAGSNRCVSFIDLHISRYIYTDKAIITVRNIVGVLMVAKKYLLPGLTEQAAQFVNEQLNIANIFTFMHLLEPFDELEQK